MPRAGSAGGSSGANPSFSDVINRAARLLGIIYGENAQLQQLTPADGVNPNESAEVAAFGMVYDVAAADWNRWIQSTVNAGVPQVEDTGRNTNPRQFESDNGFRSPVVARAGGVATALWTIATAPARTAGLISTIYTLEIENATGAAVTAWLEIGGVAITVPIHVADDATVIIDYGAGFLVGDNDINCNASVNAVNFKINGTEI